MNAASERWPSMGRWMAGEPVDAHLLLADAKSVCAFLRAKDLPVVPAVEPEPECSGCGAKGLGWPLCRACDHAEKEERDVSST